MPIIWPGERSILERFPDDIILLLAEEMAGSDLWGSVSALSQVSHELKRVVSPFLAERKKRIWMRLDDWDWSEINEDQKIKYSGIGYVSYVSKSRRGVLTPSIELSNARPQHRYRLIFNDPHSLGDRHLVLRKNNV